jgi:hypothetical protein
MKNFRSALLAAALLLSMTTAAQACPGCKEALAANDGVQGDIISGYFWSILFMMSMPFTILGMFGIVIYRAMRKSQAAEAQAAEQLAEKVGV